MEIETPQGTVLLDDADAYLLTGKVTVRPNPNNRHRDVTVAGKPLAALIMKPGKGRVVDHINRNPLDNRRENLRLATGSQNMANREGWGKSLPKGVSHHPARPGKGPECFQARIGVNSRRISLGTYRTPEEAGRAYDKAALQHYGEFAVLNFPDEQGTDNGSLELQAS